MRRWLILLVALSAACSPLTGLVSPASTASPVYSGLGLQALGRYRATFDLTFAGASTWGYHLETRSDGRAIEYSLHIDGVAGPRNPGDVRMVSQAGTNRMRGPGTEDQCLLFPSDLDVGPSFLTPDRVMDPNMLTEPLTPQGGEAVVGRQATRYTLRQAKFGSWSQVEISLWIDQSTHAALRYDLRGSGTDPFFAAGQGQITGTFRVVDLGPQTIEPIAGCEINLPLPKGITNLAKLPGVVAFDTSASVADMAAFYQAQLPAQGWGQAADPSISTDAAALSYRRSGQTLDVSVVIQGDGVHVELQTAAP